MLVQYIFSFYRINYRHVYFIINMLITLILISLFYVNLSTNKIYTLSQFSISLPSPTWSIQSDSLLSTLSLFIFGQSNLLILTSDSSGNYNYFTSIPMNSSLSQILVSFDSNYIIVGSNHVISIYHRNNITSTFELLQIISDTNYTTGCIQFSHTSNSLSYYANSTIKILTRNKSFLSNQSIAINPNLTVTNIILDPTASYLLLIAQNITDTGVILFYAFNATTSIYQLIQTITFNIPITSITSTSTISRVIVGLQNIIVLAFNGSMFEVLGTIYTFDFEIDSISSTSDGNTVVCVFNKTIQIYNFNQTTKSYLLNQTIVYNTLLQKQAFVASDGSILMVSTEQSITFWTLACQQNYQWNSTLYRCVLNCQNDPNSIHLISNNSCACNFPYIWNYQLLFCAVNCNSVTNSYSSNYNISTCRCKPNTIATNSPSCLLQCSLVSNSNGTLKSESSCYCSQKYYWNSTTYQCQLDCSQISNSNGSLSSDKCRCNNQYQWSTTLLDCFTQANNSTLGLSLIVIILLAIISFLVILLGICYLYKKLRQKNMQKLHPEELDHPSMVDLCEGKIDNISQTCSICLQTSKTVRTNCNHYFHYKCITQWCKSQYRCPNCNKQAGFKLLYRCKECDKYNSIVKICGSLCKQPDHTLCYKRQQKSLEMCIYCRYNHK